jgi:SAM-dependent methyltransferase
MNNRFFTYDDKKIDKLIVPLEPNFWWSRQWEYCAALEVIDGDKTGLEACCGTYHPFKFALSDVTKKVYAFDKSDLSKENILKDTKIMFGESEVSKFDKSYFDKTNMIKCDIKDLIYKDKFFDVIYLVSSLEHFDEETRLQGLRELKRILKDDGRIFVTVDYPTLLPEVFIELVKEVGLEIDGEYNYQLPDNAINSTYFGERLYCYFALLKKPQKKHSKK